MGRKEKLIAELRNNPKGFTFDDAVSLFKKLKFHVCSKGKTSGSRVMFVSEEHGAFLLHKPHPQKELQPYQVRAIIEFLEQEELI